MTTPVLTYAFQPVRVVDEDSRWPQATVVYFMVLAAEDAYLHLSEHYNSIEQWILSGRQGPKPQLPYYA